MENKKEFCKCLNPIMINALYGIDLNCHDCGNEVAGARESFKRQPFYYKYTEILSGIFEETIK